VLLKTLNKIFKFLSLLIIGFYRSLGSAWLGGSCRFEPSCSSYCQEAFQKYSFLYALKVSLLRLSRCRPGGGCGYDPLPINDAYQKLHICRGHQ
jgi:putative membrane protein insertion efficiency factor